MGLSNRDKMSTSLSGDARGIFCQSLKLIHPAVWEEMRNRYTDTQTEGVASANKIIDYLRPCFFLNHYKALTAILDFDKCDYVR